MAPALAIHGGTGEPLPTARYLSWPPGHRAGPGARLEGPVCQGKAVPTPKVGKRQHEASDRPVLLPQGTRPAVSPPKAEHI